MKFRYNNPYPTRVNLQLKLDKLILIWNKSKCTAKRYDTRECEVGRPAAGHVIIYKMADSQIGHFVYRRPIQRLGASKLITTAKTRNKYVI